jgi:hypothetical protein
VSVPFNAAAARTGQEVDVHWDAETGFVIVEADPEIAELELRVHAGVQWANALLTALLIATGALGAVCIIAQAVKWIAM